MHDKLVAGLVTAVVIAPICAVCVLGPAVLGSVFAGAFGWIAGLSPVATAGLAMVGAIIVYGYFDRKKRAALRDGHPPCGPGKVSQRTELPAARPARA